MFRLKKSSSG